MRNLLISVAILLVSVCQAGTSVTSLKEQSNPTFEAQTGENVTRLNSMCAQTDLFLYPVDTSTNEKVKKGNQSGKDE